MESSGNEVSRAPTGNWSLGRRGRIAALVGLWIVGFGLAWFSAKCMLDFEQRELGLLFAGLSVAAFTVAAWRTRSVIPSPKLWDIVNAVGLAVLTTFFTILVGAVAVGLVRWRSPWVRWPSAIGVAAVAGGLAALADWHFHPLRRRLPRCVAVGVFAMVLSLVAQRLCYVFDASDQWADVYAPLLGWGLGLGIGSCVAWWRWTPPRPAVGGKARRAHHPARHVAHGFALAALITLAAFAFFAWGSSTRARNDLFAHPKDRGYGTDSVDVGQLTGPALANRFAPVLYFAPREPWHPTSVNWYIAKTQIQCSQTNKCHRSYRDDGCDSVDGHCAIDGSASDAILYALTRRLPRGAMPPKTAYADVDRIVQYWVFYNYDVFNRFIVSQWHQADWEQITVGVAGGRPKFVAYSSHCFGTWLPWANVRVERGTHPLAWVALGTHANYPRPFEAPLRGGRCPSFDPPKHFGLAGLAYGLIEAGGSLEVPVDIAAALTDETGNDRRRIRPLWLPFQRRSAIDFDGTWGRDNNISLFRLKPFTSGAPNSPTAHPEWQRPGASILCNSKWFGPARRYGRIHKDDPIARGSCALITGIPRFSVRDGVYCYTHGRATDFALTCWRASDGKTRTLLAAGRSRPKRGENSYAIGFHPDNYAPVRAGQTFELLCRKDSNGKRVGCHSNSEDATGDVVFSCTVDTADVTCRSARGRAYPMPR